MAIPIGISRSLARRGNGTIWTGSGIPPVVGGDPYDLYATDTQSRGVIPFAVNWPVQPTTTSVVGVSNNTQLASAVSQSNVEIQIAAGSYNAINLNGASNQRYVLADEAILAGLTVNNSNFIEVNGGRVRTSTGDSITNTSDFLMRNVDYEGEGFSLAEGLPIFRVAFVRNRIWNDVVGMISLGAGATQFSSDIIIAGNYVAGGLNPSGTEPGIRIQRNLRTIIVDNRTRCGLDGQGVKHTYRSHYGNDNFWMRNNMQEYGNGISMSPRANADPIQPDDRMGDHWVYDHTSYYPIADANIANMTKGQSSSANWIGTFTAYGNTAYHGIQTNPAGVTGVTSNRWRFSPLAGDDIPLSEQIEFPYQAPPAGAVLADGVTTIGPDH